MFAKTVVRSPKAHLCRTPSPPRALFSFFPKGTLRRLAKMSAAIEAQSAALAASNDEHAAAAAATAGQDGLSSGVVEEDLSAGDGDRRAARSDASDGGGEMSTLASFLEFQRSLSER